MSLKAFHIFFIVISATLAFGFAVWSVLAFNSTANWLMLVVAGISTLTGVGLIMYGIRFLKKLKHVSFI